MVEKFGEEMVQVINHKTYKETLSITFKEYIDRINKKEKLYLTVNNLIANLIDKEAFMKKYYDFLPFDGFCNIFIGNRHSYTHLHSELAASCAVHLNGIKKWYLIDPKYSVHMHSIGDKNSMFRSSAYGFFRSPNMINHVPHIEVYAEKGDFLYVPPWYWHETLNMTDETIMLSWRPNMFSAPYKTNSSYSLQSFSTTLLYNPLIMPLWKNLPVYDPNEDSVVKSIKVIHNRLPPYFVNVDSQENH